MSLTSLLASPKSVQVGTKTIVVKPFTINEIARLQDWVNRTARNPLNDLLPSLHTCDPSVKKDVLAAFKQWTPPQFGTPEADAQLQSIHGLRQVFRTIVIAGDPRLTETDADAIAAELPFGDFADQMGSLMIIAFGESEGEQDPKAPEQPSIGTESLVS